LNNPSCRELADLSDFEYARDRIMMGIERKKLSMSDKERLHTAIHESGHAIACYFSKGAKSLYKATIVARGGSLGAVREILRIIINLDIHGPRRQYLNDQGKNSCRY